MSRLGKLIAGAACLGILTAASPALATDFNCTPAHVAVFNGRAHVRCTTSGTDGAASILFWAVPASDTQFTNRFISVATTALVSGRSLVLKFNSGDTSGAAFGCLASDCRAVFGIVVQ